MRFVVVSKFSRIDQPIVLPFSNGLNFGWRRNRSRWISRSWRVAIELDDWTTVFAWRDLSSPRLLLLISKGTFCSLKWNLATKHRKHWTSIGYNVSVLTSHHRPPSTIIEGWIKSGASLGSFDFHLIRPLKDTLRPVLNFRQLHHVRYQRIACRLVLSKVWRDGERRIGKSPSVNPNSTRTI